MSSNENSRKYLRIPPWLRTPLPEGGAFKSTCSLIGDLGLNTVCQSAKCPNKWECFSKKTATFLIMGQVCTRNCAFCNITAGRPEDIDPTEPLRVAEAVNRLELKHAVVTSVTRDDMPDGGAGFFAETVRRIREKRPTCTIEVLIPDFRGDQAALNLVLESRPDVLNHNVETVPGLYSRIRPQASYEQSLELLRRVKESGPGIACKSGLMTGLGETPAEIKLVIDHLAGIGCDIVTIGQYMQPTRNHPRVERYMPPDEFALLADYGREKGVPHMFSAPLVRSSYHAEEFMQD